MPSSDRLDNVNPTLYDRTGERRLTEADWDDAITDPVDVREIFDLIRDINDPEHPLTLEQLNVVTEEQITVEDDKNNIVVMFTPTIPHCSMATLIGPSVKQFCSVLTLLLSSTRSGYTGEAAEVSVGQVQGSGGDLSWKPR